MIENRAGAGGNIGMAAVAQAKPDGYTLGVAPAGALTVNPHLGQSMPFALKDLAPITLLAEIPFVLVAAEQVPARTVAETIGACAGKTGRAVDRPWRQFDRHAPDRCLVHAEGRRPDGAGPLSRDRAGDGRTCWEDTCPSRCWISPHPGN